MKPAKGGGAAGRSVVTCAIGPVDLLPAPGLGPGAFGFRKFIVHIFLEITLVRVLEVPCLAEARANGGKIRGVVPIL